MDKYIEKKIRKYVIATLDTPTLYLKKIPARREYYFVDDIEMATKTTSENLIKQVLGYYYYDTGLDVHDVDLITIPVDITYELINLTE